MARSRAEIVTGPTRQSDEETSSGGVSLEVLCRRAERLIDSVRMMGEQVDRMFSRPDRAVAEANETARGLTELRDQIDARLAEAKRMQDFCAARLQEFQNTLPTIQQSAEGLIKRVMRARELSDAFGKLMDSGADKIAAIESAADEARKAREAIGTAIEELARMQKSADHWADSVRQLNARQAEFITSSNAAAGRLRTLSDAGERLRESVREDIVTLRELLRESRLERLAWEKLLGHMPAELPAITDATGTCVVHSPKSVPAKLAERVRRLTDFVRQAAETREPKPAPASPTPLPMESRLEPVMPVQKA